jgi:hypothetical protein
LPMVSAHGARDSAVGSPRNTFIEPLERCAVAKAFHYKWFRRLSLIWWRLGTDQAA